MLPDLSHLAVATAARPIPSRAVARPRQWRSYTGPGIPITRRSRDAGILARQTNPQQLAEAALAESAFAESSVIEEDAEVLLRRSNPVHRVSFAAYCYTRHWDKRLQALARGEDPYLLLDIVDSGGRMLAEHDIPAFLFFSSDMVLESLGMPREVIDVLTVVMTRLEEGIKVELDNLQDAPNEAYMAIGDLLRGSPRSAPDDADPQTVQGIVDGTVMPLFLRDMLERMRTDLRHAFRPFGEWVLDRHIRPDQLFVSGLKLGIPLQRIPGWEEGVSGYVDRGMLALNSMPASHSTLASFRSTTTRMNVARSFQGSHACCIVYFIVEVNVPVLVVNKFLQLSELRAFPFEQETVIWEAQRYMRVATARDGVVEEVPNWQARMQERGGMFPNASATMADFGMRHTRRPLREQGRAQGHEFAFGAVFVVETA